MHPAATGEEFVAWKWAEALSELVDLTVFAFEYEGRVSLAETLPNAEVLSRPMPKSFGRFYRFAAMAKPTYPIYMRSVREVLRLRRGEFDVAHQIMPQAVRYPIPLRNCRVPYVVGPLGGALETPEAFRNEGKGAAWYTRARAVDRAMHPPSLAAKMRASGA